MHFFNWRRFLGGMTALGMLSFASSGCAQEKVKADGEGEAEAIQLEYDRQNDQLVADLRSKGIANETVLKALRETPRHLFVPESIRDSSYEDNALPIGLKQTISQPYVVAYMTEVLQLAPEDRVLEVGTGSGYQAAILSKLVKKVYSIEILEPLAKRARLALDALSVDNVVIRVGDGYKGWPDQAPFDAIIVTAAPNEIPQALVNQLKDGGKMILPVGKGDLQWLVLITRENGRTKEKQLIPVRFVPMVHGSESQSGFN